MKFMFSVADTKRMVLRFFRSFWPKHALSQRDKGILCLLGAAVSFALLDFCVKLTGDIPFIQKSLFRNFMSFILTLVLMKRLHISFRPQNDTKFILLARAAVGTVATWIGFYAVSHLLLADATMIGQTAPFFTVLFSAILIKEKLKSYQIMMLILAFAGSIFVIKPQFGSASVPALIALAGGITAGLCYSLLRILGTRGENKILVVFYFSAFSSAASLPFVIFDYAPMTWQQYVYLILAGIFGCIGQLGITYAYNYAPANEISVFNYAQVPVAALLGFLFLSQFPDAWSIIGYLIVIGAGIAMFLLNQKYQLKN